MLSSANRVWNAAMEEPLGGFAQDIPRLAADARDAYPDARPGARRDVKPDAESGARPGAKPDAELGAIGSSSETEAAAPWTGSGNLRTPLHVLIVDDDLSVRNACAEVAGRFGFPSMLADSVASARAVLEAQPVDILLLDLKLPGGGGLLLLEEVRRLYPGIAIVVMTAYATVHSAVEAMRSGAGDYLTKPFGLEELTEVLERMSRQRTFDLNARALRERLRADAAAGMGPLVGRSPAMEKLYRMLGKVAFTTHPVLILGESGTGKEVVARLIHSHGPNSKKPFIPVDCGSLVPTLIESELFGHVKGAFTGAVRAKDGLLVAAGNGTVFLDEIGELPLDLQAKLLRALQEKEVRPVGATHAVPIGARILAATNQDLPAMVENGRFRKDLYFRLNVVNVHLPSLRERKADIPLLAVHILERVCRETGKRCTFSDDALRLLVEYDWPGNVRELEHAIEHAVTLSSGPVLHRADFPAAMQNYRPSRKGAPEPDPEATASDQESESPRVVFIAEMEKQAILNTIRQLNGDKIKAARLLGIGKTTLYRKLKEYGIDSASSPDD